MNQNKISRRDFLKVSGAGALSLAISPKAFSSLRNNERPNILYIMTDDHTKQAMSCYGSRLNSTPNIDRIAREGVRFNKGFCTNAICAPSRATLLTGTYGHINGMTDNSKTFDGNQITFPKLLQQAGYQTSLIGKWHLKSDPTGFDYWNILPGQGQYYNPDYLEMGRRYRITGYGTDIATDLAFNWLESRSKDKPFCMLLHYNAPHRNWMPGPNHLNLFNEKEFPLPDTFFDDYSNRGTAARSQKMMISDLRIAADCKITPRFIKSDESTDEKNDRTAWEGYYNRLNDEQKKKWDEAYLPVIEKYYKTNPTGKDLVKFKFQRYMHDYLRCVQSVDDNIGKVLDYLDKNGLAQNTIVVYTSDQGFYLGEHGWFDKRFMYEESFSIPLLIRFPNEIKPHTNDSDFVMNLDFAPTILDYCGVPIPSRMQGASIRKICAQQTPENWRQSVYYHYYEYPAEHSVKRHYGVRNKRYKLIHFYNDVDEWELYDLEKDPRELHNVYSDPDYAKTVIQMRSELDRSRKYYNDEDSK